MPCPGDPGPRPDFIPAPDAAKLVMRYIIFSQTVENVHYFSRPGGYDATTLSALALAAFNSWDTNLKSMIPSDATLVDITATDVSVDAGASVIAPVNVAGTHANPGLETIGNTWVIKFNTGLSGRSNRGRMYFPQLGSTSVVNGQVTSGAAIAIVGAVNNFFDGILSDSGDQHVIVSYQNDCEWRDTAAVTDVLSYSYTDLYLDSQRRRLTGRGA